MDQAESSSVPRLLVPQDPGFGERCRLWNGLLAPRPVAIAECSTVDDVVNAVRTARARGWSVSVRGGGHGVAGRACRDGSLMIDLRGMRRVSVDPVNKIGRAEGGATWFDFDRATAEHGLASTGGMISSTGVTGLTLGGGIGWLLRQHGLACDNLLAAEIVMADGQLLRVDANHEPELFWALRGAGIGFGAVTAVEFTLHEVREVLAGILMHPASRAREALQFFREFCNNLPDQLTPVFVFTCAPPAPFVPEDLHFKPVVAIGACWCGDIAEGDRVIGPLRAFGPPQVDLIAPRPYCEAQMMLDPTAPEHQLNYWKSAFLPALTDEAMDCLVARGTSLPSPLAQVHIHCLGGAAARVAPTATAYEQRSAPFLVNIPTMWAEPHQTEAMIAWTRETHSALAGASDGSSYLNFQDRDEAPSDALGGSTRERLCALKEALDPNRLFGPDPVG